MIAPRKLVWQGILTTGLMLAGPGVARADFNDGVVAYAMGDYDKAFTTMQSLAETTNHGLAQYYLGMMHMRGQGTEQDYKSAGEWFRRSAENHVAQAQYKLGQFYMQGRGVPKDYEFAYAWFRTSAALEHKKAEAAIARARERLSAEEISEAEKLSEKFIAQYGPTKEGVDLSQPIHIDN